LGYQRVIGSAQVNEPIPVLSLAQQKGGGVKGICDHSGPSVGNQVGLNHRSHVSEFHKERLVAHEIRQLQPLPRRGLKVQVHRVVVPRMVQSLQRPFQTLPVARRARYQVGDSRHRPRRCGTRPELGLHEMWLFRGNFEAVVALR